MANVTVWTDEKIKQLKGLHGKGLSAKQISLQMSGFSRNAVIGKLHRLNLSGAGLGKIVCKIRAQQSRKAASKRQGPRKPLPLQSQQRRTIAKLMQSVSPLPVTEELLIPLAERKSLSTLTPGCCRWGIGDPQHADFHFCGKSKVTGLPYCEFHARKAYATRVAASSRPYHPAPTINYGTYRYREVERA